jgi:hypothetical protein
LRHDRAVGLVGNARQPVIWRTQCRPMSLSTTGPIAH